MAPRVTIAAATEQFRGLSMANIRYILNEAVQDVIEGAQTPQPSVKVTGGSFEEGKIPVDTTELINSLHLDGVPVGEAPSVAGMIEPGARHTFEWQTPYAARINWGFVGEDSLGRYYNQAGRYFVDRNAERFPEFIDRHAREVRT